MTRACRYETRLSLRQILVTPSMRQCMSYRDRAVAWFLRLLSSCRQLLTEDESNRCVRSPGVAIRKVTGTTATRQLQHSRTLALAQAREQHHLAVREFQRIVMQNVAVHVDLPVSFGSSALFLF